jgi:hypothetical protein
MAKTIQINPVKTIRNTGIRYNFVIFVVIIVCSLIFAVIVLSTILSQPDSSSSVTTTDFDQATINRINGLDTSANNSNYNNLPTGRINPFFE